MYDWIQQYYSEQLFKKKSDDKEFRWNHRKFLDLESEFEAKVPVDVVLMSCHNLVLRAGQQFSYRLLIPESPRILKAAEYSGEQGDDEREIHLSLKLESPITEMGEILPNSGVNQKPPY